MSDERDELAAILNGALENFYEPFDWHEATRIAGRLLAAGYRKPRTVTTAEELDALPSGTVILAANNEAFIAANHDRQYGPKKLWASSGTSAFDSEWFTRPVIGAGLPAVVLWEPEA